MYIWGGDPYRAMRAMEASRMLNQMRSVGAITGGSEIAQVDPDDRQSYVVVCFGIRAKLEQFGEVEPVPNYGHQDDDGGWFTVEAY